MELAGLLVRRLARLAGKPWLDGGLMAPLVMSLDGGLLPPNLHLEIVTS